MSDLSVPLGASPSSATGLLNGLRPIGGGNLSGAPGASSESPSFSAVLRDKANAVNAADTAAKVAAKAEAKPAEKAERPRERDEATADQLPDRVDNDAAPAKVGKSEQRQDQQDDTKADAATAETTTVQDASTATPIATVMVQLPPAALLAAATQAAAGEIANQGAIVRELARGHGHMDKDSPGNRGLALAVGQALNEDGPAGGAITTLTDVSGQGAGTADGQASPGTQASAQDLAELGNPNAALNKTLSTAQSTVTASAPGAIPVTAALSAEEDIELTGSTTTSSQDADFTQVLARARDGQVVNASSENVSQTSRSDTSLPMRAQVGHPNWSNEVGDKMTWMVTQQKQHADLVLNPPQLGRIEVSLTISGDQASATFTSPNAAVRDMLENSLPRLREILAGSGLNLGQADVGAQSFAQQQQMAQDNQRAAALASNAPAEVAHDAPQLASGARNLGRAGERSGVVDVFA